MSVSLDIVPPSLEVPTCCGSTPDVQEVDDVTERTTRFHFSLNVSNLERSVAFYSRLFGVPPAKQFPDYAKFELTHPPLVFSLVPNAPATVGSLSHLGFPVASLAEVEEAARRLTAAGLEVSCQRDTTCGYARQDKIWIADPDHNYWEVYVAHADVDPAEVRRTFDGVSPLASSSVSTAPQPVIWEHRVTEAAPVRIPWDDATVDEVRLTGTFNAALSLEERRHLLAEARRVLKPGGQLAVHGLVASEDLGGERPQLPGVAALVKRTPIESEPLDELAAAGFVNLQITRLPQKPVFEHGAVELREVKLTACQPSAAAESDAQRLVVYKGPFAETTDDSGATFLRGHRTAVTLAQWNDLARSAAASQFLFIDGQAHRACPGN